MILLVSQHYRSGLINWLDLSIQNQIDILPHSMTSPNIIGTQNGMAAGRLLYNK